MRKLFSRPVGAALRADFVASRRGRPRHGTLTRVVPTRSPFRVALDRNPEFAIKIKQIGPEKFGPARSFLY